MFKFITFKAMEVKIVNKSKHPIPQYESRQAAGVDLRANLAQTISLNPMQRILIPTGLFLEIPAGYEAQVRPRSGLALKKGLTVLNAPGTIDADYRGEVGVILINLSDAPVEISDGERVAQLVFAAFAQPTFIPVVTLSETERGTGGFGSTGVL